MPKADLTRERVSALPGTRVSPMGAGRPAYVAAPAVGNANQMRELASSLGSLAPKLERLAAQRADEKMQAAEQAKKDAAEREKAEKERQENLANQTLASMTLEQVNQKITDGTLKEYENPYFKAAVDKIRGVRTATAEARELSEQVARGEVDPLSDDFEALITGRSATTLEGASEHFTSGYHGTMFREREKLLGQQTNARIVEAEQERVDGAHTILRDVVMNAQTPEEAFSQLQIAKGEIKGTLNMSFGEMDEIVLNIAEEIALTGDADRVEQILTSKRTGSNGEDLGSISSKRGYGAKTQTLIQRAKNIRDSVKVEKDYNILMEYDDRIASGNITVRDIRSDERLTGADKRSLSNQLRAADSRRAKEAQDRAKEIRAEKATRSMEIMAVQAVSSGNGFMLDDMELEVDGKTIRMSADEAREFGMNAAVKMRMDAIDAQYGENVPEGIKEAAIQKIVQQNNQNYKPWENLLSAAGSIASFSNITTEEEIPPQLMAAVDLYNRLDTNTASAHIADKDTRTLLRGIKVAEERLGYSRGQAVLHAMNVRESNVSGKAGVQAKEISSVISDFDFKEWALGEGPKDNFRGIMFAEIEARAVDIATSTGVAPAIAVEEAGKEYFETHTLVKGIALPVPKGYSKDHFNDVASGFIEAWNAKFNPSWIGTPGGKDYLLGDDGSKYFDLNLRTMDGGRTYMMFDGLTPLGPQHTFSVENFRRFERERQSNENEEHREKAREVAKKRNGQALQQRTDDIAEDFDNAIGDIK